MGADDYNRERDRLLEETQSKAEASRFSCAVSTQTAYGPSSRAPGILAEIQLSCGVSKFRLQRATLDEGAESHIRCEAWEELGTV